MAEEKSIILKFADAVVNNQPKNAENLLQKLPISASASEEIKTFLKRREKLKILKMLSTYCGEKKDYATKAELDKKRGDLLFKWEKYEYAAKEYGFAAVVFRRLGNSAAQATCDEKCGDCLLLLRRYQGAAREFRYAAEVFKDNLNDFKNSGRCYIRLVNCLFILEKWDDAKEVCELAEKMLNKALENKELSKEEEKEILKMLNDCYDKAITATKKAADI